MSQDVRDNRAAQCFELDAEGHVAFSEYKRTGDVVEIRHTEVPSELGGKGVGSRLVRGLLDLVRAECSKVRPRCPFVRRYIEKHAEYQDLLA